MRFTLFQRRLNGTRVVNGGLVLGLAYLIARSRLGFPFPPHSRAEWAILFMYVAIALALISQVNIEMTAARERQRKAST